MLQDSSGHQQEGWHLYAGLVEAAKEVLENTPISHQKIMWLHEELLSHASRMSHLSLLPSDVKQTILMFVWEDELNSKDLFFLHAACKCKRTLLGLCENVYEMDAILFVLFGMSASEISWHLKRTCSLSQRIYAFARSLLRFQTGFVYLKHQEETPFVEPIDPDLVLLYDNDVFGTCVSFVEDGMMRTTMKQVQIVADAFLRAMNKRSTEEFEINFHHCVSYGRKLLHPPTQLNKNALKVGILSKGEARPIWFFFKQPARNLHILLCELC